MESNIKEEIEISPSTIETVDYALFNWIKDLKSFCTTNKGWKEVPVKWVLGERSYQTKADSKMRDASGALILPMITVERTGMVKDLAKKGTIYGAVPPALVHSKLGDTIVIARKINQRKTANFANAKTKYLHNQLNFRTRKENKRVVYETVTIPIPVYVDVTYKITIRSEYQQQMNEILQPFITKTRGTTQIRVSHEDHSFQGFVQGDFTQDNTAGALELNERNFKTAIEIKVLGLLIGDGPNDEKPRIVKRENAIEIKLPRERVMYGDIPDVKNSKYRE
tara:strand:+ start:1832 stop:2671 length:840 start_codon:yes stop_codon:yes gene_type:complete